MTFLQNWRRRASVAGIRTAHPNERPMRTCVACFENISDEVPELACGHGWCSSCLVRAFSNIRNQSQWPVRCSGGCYIPLSAAFRYLSEATVQRLERLVRELEIPASERVYCSNSRCSEMMSRLEAHGHTVRCKECLTGTCADCKATAHPGRSCPLPDRDEQQTLDLSEEKNWQRCRRCGQMCERDGGCPHMVCVCGYDFCYHCGENIYTCNGCPRVEHGSGVAHQALYAGLGRRTRDQQLHMLRDAQARPADRHAQESRQDLHREESQEHHVTQTRAPVFGTLDDHAQVIPVGGRVPIWWTHTPIPTFNETQQAMQAGTLSIIAQLHQEPAELPPSHEGLGFELETARAAQRQRSRTERSGHRRRGVQEVQHPAEVQATRQAAFEAQRIRGSAEGPQADTARTRLLGGYVRGPLWHSRPY